MKSCELKVLTDAELFQIFKIRSHQLEEWLTKEGWKPGYIHTDKFTLHPKGKSCSLLIAECLIEIEARTVNDSEQNKPCLAASQETNDGNS